MDPSARERLFVSVHISVCEWQDRREREEKERKEKGGERNHCSQDTQWEVGCIQWPRFEIKIFPFLIM